MRLLARPWFPLAAIAATVLAVVAAALLPRPDGSLLDAPPEPWTGSWDTIWPGGGATLHLEQRGETITGTYPLYDGQVEGRVDGRRFVGRWFDPTRGGNFELFLAPDAETFVGRYENGQYWNGRRLERGEARAWVQPDLRSPRDTLTTFLDSIYWTRAGQHERLETAMAALVTEGEATVGERASDAALLFDVLDRTTFALSSVKGREDPIEDDVYTATLRQAGTTNEIEVVFARDANDQWRIVPHSREWLENDLQTLLQARGETRVDPQRQLQQSSPRAAMQLFLESTERWGDRGEELAMRCLDLSEIDASVRDIEARIHAFTLKRVLDSVGYVHLWGISDDPNDALPYVHYRHALGEIVIAPKVAPVATGAEDGAPTDAGNGPTRWAFTPRTLRTLSGLQDALEGFGLVAGTHALPSDPYFGVRQFARSLSPDLVDRDFLLENWQWVGLLLLGLAGWWAGALVHWLGRRAVGLEGETAADERVSSREVRYVVPSRVLVTTLVWLFGLRLLGLPDRLQVVLLTISLVAAVLGGVWIGIAGVSSVSQRLLHKARRTQTRLDEILVTLLASVAKIGIVVLGLVVLAEGLALPYQSVLAGIGIGGLAVAIAARDTVANFFGSAVLISDRPFKRGDLVQVMGHLGEVERVGIRSTHIRTYDDSVVVIPNSTLVNELIDNRGRRRRRKVEVTIGVQYDSPPAKIQRLVEELRQLVGKQPRGIEEGTLVGLWDFGPSSIDVRLWAFLDVQSLADERTERHRLLLDVVRLVDELGLDFAFPTRTLHVDSVPYDTRTLEPQRTRDAAAAAAAVETGRA